MIIAFPTARARAGKKGFPSAFSFPSAQLLGIRCHIPQLAVRSLVSSSSRGWGWGWGGYRETTMEAQLTPHRGSPRPAGVAGETAFVVAFPVSSGHCAFGRVGSGVGVRSPHKGVVKEKVK